MYERKFKLAFFSDHESYISLQMQKKSVILNNGITDNILVFQNVASVQISVSIKTIVVLFGMVQIQILSYKE